MSIDSKDDQLNIKDLIIPTQETSGRLKFDNDVDAALRDFDRMIEAKPVITSVVGYPIQLDSDKMYFLRTLALVRPALARVHFSQELWSAIIDNLHTAQDILGVYNKAEQTTSFLFAAPNKGEFEEYAQDLVPRLKEEYGDPIGEDPSLAFSLLKSVKVLAPDRISEFPISDELMQRVKAMIPSPIDTYDASNIGELLADIKIVDPHLLTKLDISDDLWQQIYVGLSKIIESNRTNVDASPTVLSAAFNLKVLTADEVRISQHGFEFVHKPRISPPQKQSPLPEHRKF